MQSQWSLCGVAISWVVALLHVGCTSAQRSLTEDTSSTVIQRVAVWHQHFDVTHPQCGAGANMIPADVFASRATPERYRAIVDSTVAAHMNMIR